MEYEETNPRKRLYLTLGVVAVVLLLAGAFLARPAYHWFKQWRALQMVEASAQALRNQDIKTASEKADDAVRLWPYDARVLRQEAKVLSLRNQSAALPVWMETWSLSHDLPDLRQTVESALYAGNNPVAVMQFGILQKADPQNPATWLLEAKIRLTENQIPEALAAFKKVLDASNAPPDAHLLYAKATVMSGDPELARDGLQHLRALTERSDELGLQALRLLGNYPALSAGDVQAIAEKIRSHPLATANDKLFALQLLGKLPGAKEDNLLQTAHDLFPANDPGSMHALALWLMTQHKYADVLKLIDPQTALTREDLFSVRIDAMAALGQWQEIDRILQQPKLPMIDEERLTYQAVTFTELGQADKADFAWQRVFNSVAEQPAEMQKIAELAMRHKYYDVARHFFQDLLSRPDQRRTAYENLVEIEQSTGHTKALHQLLLDMEKAYPDDLLVRNDVLYTGFLLGEADEEQLNAARHLVNDSKSPFLSFKVTQALGLLTAGQPAEALKAFTGVTDSTWPNVTDSWKAVYVGVLRANGQREIASHIEQAIHPDNLLPEEKKLLLVPLPPETLQ